MCKSGNKSENVANAIAQALNIERQDIMTMGEIKKSKKDINSLGFNVCMIGSVVKIPRKAFIDFMEVQNAQQYSNNGLNHCNNNQCG